MIYAVLTEYCTAESCPVMTAGKFTFLWTEGVQAPEQVTAAEYVKRLMTWVSQRLNDPQIFPTDIKTVGRPFPSKFRSTVKKILQRLFRIHAHIFHTHYRVSTPEFPSRLKASVDPHVCLIL